MKHNKYPNRKALQMGYDRRIVQKSNLEMFIQANPDYQIQINYSVPDNPGNVCIKLTGGYAKKLTPFALKLFEGQIKSIQEKLIEIDMNQNLK